MSSDVIRRVVFVAEQAPQRSRQEGMEESKRNASCGSVNVCCGSAGETTGRTGA